MSKDPPCDDKLMELVEPVAYKTARLYARKIPHLAFEDVAGELILAQVCAIVQTPYRPFLKQVANNRAIDLVRKGKHRDHDELNQVITRGDDGDELTLGEWLATAGQPDLVERSAEDEYLLSIEAPQRMQEEISKRALRIGLQRLQGQPSSGADHTYLWAFRKNFPPEKKADLFDYFS